jgi:hypothetical protein
VIESPNDPAAQRTANVSFILFIAGGVVGLFQMATSVIPFGKGFEMVALAENLARSGAYANPFAVLATGPTAANPPLYPFLLAVIIRVFRIPGAILFAATICNVLVNALAASWLPRLSSALYRDLRPGIVASVLWLLAIPLIPSWDASFAVATLLLFCLSSFSGIEKQDFVLHGALAGLLAGALFLFNPSTIMIFLPWLAWLAVTRRAACKGTALYCGAVLAVVFLVAFVWGFRNHQQLGKFVIRTNLGMTLYASNNDCARSSLIADERNNCYQSHHPNTSLGEAELLQKIGEPAYDRKRIEDAKTWIQTHPGPFMHLTAARVRDFWFPPATNHPFRTAVIWFTTIVSVPGFILMASRRVKVASFMIFVLLVYPLMYYVVVSDVRYRLPVLWLSLLPAGYFLTHVARRLFDSIPAAQRLRHRASRLTLYHQ